MLSDAPGARRLLGSGLAAFLMLLTGVLPAQAQTIDDALLFSQRSPALGARMMGLAGAGTAGLADYSALFFNPAGLSLAERSMVVGMLNGASITNDGLYQAVGVQTGLEETRRSDLLGGLGYVYKAPTVQGSLAFGISYNQTNLFDRTLGFGGENGSNSVTDFFLPFNGGGIQEFSVTALDPDDSGETVFGQFIVEDQETGTSYLIDFDPDGNGFINRPLSFVAFETFGVDFAPGLFEDGDSSPFLPAVSAGTVTQSGTVIEDGTIQELSLGGAVEVVENTHLGVSANFVFGEYNLDEQFTEEDTFNENDGNFGTTDFEALTLRQTLDSDLTGFNLRFGLSTQPLEVARIGLTLETPTFYAISERFSTELTTVFDNGDVFAYGDEFSEDVGSGSFDYEIRTPWRLGLGGALILGNLEVLGDFELIDWTQLEFDADVDRAFFEALNQRIDEELEVVVNSRLGAEYDLSGITLRAGVAYQPDPRTTPLQQGDGATLDRDRTFVSLGLGVRLAEQLVLDIGWMQERFDNQYLPYTEVTSAPVVDEEVRRNRFALGISYMF